MHSHIRTYEQSVLFPFFFFILYTPSSRSRAFALRVPGDSSRAAEGQRASGGRLHLQDDCDRRRRPEELRWRLRHRAGAETPGGR